MESIPTSQQQTKATMMETKNVEKFDKNSTTLPLSITTIVSEFMTVDNLCATVILVILLDPSFLSFQSLAPKELITTLSDSPSSALVASSRRRMAGRLRRVLAIAIRCFCPPESWLPFSPTTVSYPFGRLLMNS
uniref:Uncharacterized protein n=2 Tax=Oryza glumipatula TaxID=40148 RepID=A0A0E0AQX2_9ORYZ